MSGIPISANLALRLGGPWLCTCNNVNLQSARICPVCGRPKADGQSASSSTGALSTRPQDRDLLDAAQHFDSRRLRLLLEQKANPNACIPGRCSPLVCCLASTSVCAPTSEESDSLTLEFGCRCFHVAKMLIDAGADPNAFTAEGGNTVIAALFHDVSRSCSFTMLCVCLPCQTPHEEQHLLAFMQYLISVDVIPHSVPPVKNAIQLLMYDLRHQLRERPPLSVMTYLVSVGVDCHVVDQPWNADPTRANKSTSDADEFGSTAKSLTLADIAVDSAASFRWDELKVGSMIDCLDTDMRWRRAQVIEFTRSSYDVNDVFVRVHYLGWSEKWDEFILLTSDRIAAPLSKWRPPDDHLWGVSPYARAQCLAAKGDKFAGVLRALDDGLRLCAQSRKTLSECILTVLDGLVPKELVSIIARYAI